MTDFQQILLELTENLNTLQEREARYAGSAPLDLLNQIADHEQAIALTKQAIAGDLDEAGWREALRPLLVNIRDRTEHHPDWGVTIGEVTGGIIGSIIAGGDVTNAQVAHGSNIAQATHGGTATVNVENIGQKIVNFFTGSSDSQRELHNRQVMLQAVRQFWVEGVLENSLHRAALIELGLEEKREAVDYPWDMILQAPNQSNRQLQPGVKMIDVFDGAGQSLLILGEPGSGKTTMLLDLARQTIDRAETDPIQPMPVVFNLSSWAEKRPPLAEWLVVELNSKYQIPKKLAQRWVENDDLLLLLDGLDEVKAEYRNNCVEAINRYLQDGEQVKRLVVCSRVADYESLSVKLNLRQAVMLQPLDSAQIEAYITAVGPELNALKSGLGQDPHLQELAESPLMFSIMILAYHDNPTPDVPQLISLEAQRQQLFEMYVQQMLARRGTNVAYPADKTRYWLAWLAQRMAAHSQTIFLIERLQPGWLSLQNQQLCYRIGCVLIFGLICGFFFAIGGLMAGLSDGLFSGLFFGLFFGLMLGLAPEDSEISTKPSQGIWALIKNIPRSGLMAGLYSVTPTETLKWSWQRFSTGLMFVLVWILIVTLMFELVIALMPDLLSALMREPVPGLRSRLVFWLAAGLMGGLVSGLILGPSPKAPEISLKPNHCIWVSLRNGLIFGLATGLILGLISGLLAMLLNDQIRGLTAGLTSGLGLGMYFGIWVGMMAGGVAFIRHFVLRFVLFSNGYAPWRYARFLDYTAERIFLRKVGGGYVFVHRYLLEYFASLEGQQE